MTAEWHVVTLDDYLSGPYATKREAMDAEGPDRRYNDRGRNRRCIPGLYEHRRFGGGHAWSVYIGTAAAMEAYGLGDVLARREPDDG